MRKLYVGIFIMLCAGQVIAQTSLSFYHLGDATFQNSSLNPAYMPSGRVFIGLPGISGVHAHVNNKWSYNNAIVSENGEKIVSVSSIIGDLQRQNMASLHGGVEIFHLGYRLKQGTVFTLFAKERFEGDVLYPKQFMEFVWKGYGNNLGEEIDLGSVGVNIMHFREIGVGVSHQLTDQLRVGARLKTYQGFLNISTPRNLDASIEVNPQTYAMNLATSNTQLRTSGLGIYDSGDLGSHLVKPGNSGFGIDLGFEYDVNKYLSFSASIVDLGYISWKTDIENTAFSDTTFNYAGVNIRNADDIPQLLQDSLLDRFATSKNTDAYKTWVPTKLYGTMTWKYNESTHFLGTVGARYIHGQMKMLYGGGVRQYFGPAVATINATKLPQQFFNVGAALAVRGGPVQYYVAADQLINFSVPDKRSFDFRMGVNIIIGKSGTGSRGVSTASTFDNSRLRSAKGKGLDTNSFLGKKVKTKRREGIYSIIGKQEKRDVPDSKKPPREKGKKKRGVKSSKKIKQKYPSKRGRY